MFSLCEDFSFCLQEHKTDEMHTALMEASMDGHVEVARLLLDSGAQVCYSWNTNLVLVFCSSGYDGDITFDII